MAIADNSFERARLAAKHARASFRSNPNILGIGVGTKRVAGAATAMWCVSISVRKKLPPGELSDELLIPRSIDGVPTDIIAMGDPSFAIADPVSKNIDVYELNTYRPLRGGITLWYAFASTQGIQPDTNGCGTLGCIALTNETPPRHVALTNRHVVSAILPHGPVGNPHVSPGSSCCGHSDLIGSVYAIAQDKNNPNQTTYFPVDAAICALNDKLTWVNGIAPQASGTSATPDPITGIWDLTLTSPPIPPNLAVRKRGARTGYTTGTVQQLDAGTMTVIGTETFDGYQMPGYFLTFPIIKIWADQGASFNISAATQANPCQITAAGNSFSKGDVVIISQVGGMTDLNAKGFQVAAINHSTGAITLSDLSGSPINSTPYDAYTSGGIVAKHQPFVLSGDSGSVVRDGSNKIVGLLFGTTSNKVDTPEGLWGLVCHIQHVLDALNITIPVTPTPPNPNLNTVPVNNNPYMAPSKAAQSNVAARVQDDLLRTTHGVTIARAIMTHEPEVRQLIQSNRRAKATWRRVIAPQTVNGFAEAVMDSRRPICLEPAHAKLWLTRFANILRRHGSDMLRNDLEQLAGTLLGMLDLTYEEILTALDVQTDFTGHGTSIRQTVIAVNGALRQPHRAPTMSEHRTSPTHPEWIRL
jgi:hypothetical protein